VLDAEQLQCEPACVLLWWKVRNRATCWCLVGAAIRILKLISSQPHQASSVPPWNESESCEELLTDIGLVSSSGTCGACRETMVCAVSVRSLRGKEHELIMFSSELMGPFFYVAVKTLSHSDNKPDANNLLSQFLLIRSPHLVMNHPSSKSSLFSSLLLLLNSLLLRCLHWTVILYFLCSVLKSVLVQINNNHTSAMQQHCAGFPVLSIREETHW